MGVEQGSTSPRHKEPGPERADLPVVVFDRLNTGAGFLKPVRRVLAANEPTAKVTVRIGKEVGEALEKPPHPYIALPTPDAHLLHLQSTTTGEELHTGLLTGRLLLALGIGQENGKSEEELLNEILGSEQERAKHTNGLRFVLPNARQITRGKGPRIQSAGDITDENMHRVFFYEDFNRKERLENFATWDDELTHFRFDPKTGFIAVSLNDQPQTAYLGDRVLKIALAYLATHPEGEISTHELRAHIEDTGYDLRQASIGSVINKIRTFVRNKLNIDPYQIMSSRRVQMGTGGKEGNYRLVADVVEVMNDDGSIRVYTNPHGEINPS